MAAPFPAKLWDLLLRFLLGEKSGIILIRVDHGRVASWELHEWGGATEADAERTFTALRRADILRPTE